MDTRIVEVDEFGVKGVGVKVPISEIPIKWDELNAAIEGTISWWKNL